MNKHTRKEWQAYISQIGDLMNLHDWTLTLVKEPANSDNAAEMDSIYGRKVVHIRLSSTWHEFTPHEQRYLIVHEIAHTYFEPMDHLLCGKMKRLFSAHDLQTWHDDYSLLLEYGVDAVAECIAPSMPLPTPSKPKRDKPA